MTNSGEDISSHTCFAFSGASVFNNLRQRLLNGMEGIEGHFYIGGE
jgi:hypothetical protein